MKCFLCAFAPLRLALIILLAACVPAAVPKPLTYTPGPPVTLLGETYDAGVFAVRAPAGWVVVSGPASEPAAVTFVSPDESATIRLSTRADIDRVADETLATRMRFHMEQVMLGDSLLLTLTLGAPAVQWDTFVPVFEAVMDSVRKNAD